MKTKLLLAFLITLALYSCQDKSTGTNTTTNNQYTGRWRFTVTTADSSSDTVTVSSDGNFTVNNITLYPQGGGTLNATAAGKVDNAATFYANVTYPSAPLPFSTVINGFTGANGSFNITIKYNDIQIGTADGSVSNTYYTGSGTFTTPMFGGSWSIAKVN